MTLLDSTVVDASDGALGLPEGVLESVGRLGLRALRRPAVRTRAGRVRRGRLPEGTVCCPRREAPGDRSSGRSDARPRRAGIASAGLGASRVGSPPGAITRRSARSESLSGAGGYEDIAPGVAQTEIVAEGSPAAAGSRGHVTHGIGPARQRELSPDRRRRMPGHGRAAVLAVARLGWRGRMTPPPPPR
jgi:hypothetical protein